MFIRLQRDYSGGTKPANAKPIIIHAMNRIIINVVETVLNKLKSKPNQLHNKFSLFKPFTGFAGGSGFRFAISIYLRMGISSNGTSFDLVINL